MKDTVNDEIKKASKGLQCPPGAFTIDPSENPHLFILCPKKLRVMLCG
jgi:hypothetical protein